MFTCNNLNLLTFAYYLKYILAINIIIVPFFYFFINYILIIRKKQNNQTINKYYLKKKIKPTFYIIVLIILSLILHNTLNSKNNVCYIYASPKTYKEYKNSYWRP